MKKQYFGLRIVKVIDAGYIYFDVEGRKRFLCVFHYWQFITRQISFEKANESMIRIFKMDGTCKQKETIFSDFLLKSYLMFYQRMALINEYRTSYPPIKKLAEKYRISDPTVRKILSEAGVYEPWGMKKERHERNKL